MGVPLTSFTFSCHSVDELLGKYCNWRAGPVNYPREVIAMGVAFRPLRGSRPERPSLGLLSLDCANVRDLNVGG